MNFSSLFWTIVSLAPIGITKYFWNY